MTDPITRARKEWCERHAGGGHKYVNVCPEEVVAALLDVVAWAKTEDCAPYANRNCACCTALGKIEDAITRELEEKP